MSDLESDSDIFYDKLSSEDEYNFNKRSNSEGSEKNS